MQYTKLGISELTVSRICMGCMGFGDASNGQHSWTVDEVQSREIIHRGLELGINFFDTAMGYQNGLSKLARFFWEDCTPDSELYVSHAGCPEKAMAIVEKIRERYHNLKYYIYPMLGTMSTQSGPDSIGIFYTKNK